MKTMFKTMKKNKIPQKKLDVFERIIQKYEGQNNECEIKFMEAMEKELTKEQRFQIFRENGGCKGTGYDKERKAFALEHANKDIAKRLEFFVKTFGKKAVLNNDKTITVTFKCTHGYYKRVREGKIDSLPLTILSYFERCAGGRLYEYEKALGIKLRIKSVDITPLNENIVNPVIFIFEIME